MAPEHDPESQTAQDLLRHAQEPHRGFIGEFYGLLRDNKKWWLLPIVIVLLLVGLLVLLAGSVVAPFLYPLF